MPNYYPIPTLYQPQSTPILPPYPYTAASSSSNIQESKYSPIPKPNLFYNTHNPETTNLDAYSAKSYEEFKQNN